MGTKFGFTLGVGLALLLAFTQAQPAEVSRVRVDIPAQALSASLTQFGRETGTEIVFAPDAVEHKKAPAIKGEFARERAIALILSGTGLSYRVTAQGAFVVEPVTPVTAAPLNGQPLANQMRVARSATALPEDAAAAATQPQDKRSRAEKAAESADNVMVVTGTNIRGAGPVGQQVQVITREEIIRSGVDSLNELRDLSTQHFGGGGANPIMFNLAQNTAATTSSTNSTYNSSFNLRGLGAGATLTLLNGRRVAPSGSNDTFGVRAIPLNIIERVEIVPDGGSAIYGSDAVGGVVNVITRSDFQGVEVSARYGSVTSAGYDQTGANAIAGHSWDTGNLVFYAGYAEEGRLDAGDRDFISLDFIRPATSLLPGGDRSGVMLSFTQAATSRLQFGADVLWSEDNTAYDLDPQLLDGFTPGIVELRSRASHASLRADYALNNRWDLTARVDRSINENIATTDSEYAGPPESELENTNTTFELSLNGVLAQLPAGPLQMAIGGLQRQQEYTQFNTYLTMPTVLKRDVNSAYGEFLVPLASGVKLSLAARWDDYENGASEVTPKYGISWQATDDLGLRASYSKAFRAPTLPQSRDSQRLNLQFARWADRPPADQDPRVPAGRSYAAILLRLGNPDLKPESASIFTAGFDVRPVAMPKLRVGVTYFDIQFDDIILSLFPNRLNDSAFAGFVTAYPGAALLQSLIDESDAFGNFTGFPADLDAVQVLLDGGAHNVSRLGTSGFDINARYGFDVGPGVLSLSLKSSYILNYELQATTLSQLENNVDRVGDPLRLTMRGSAAYGVGSWTFSLGANYKGSYVNDVFAYDPPAPQPIDSQTTFDLGLHYDSAAANLPASWAKNLRVSLNVRNVTDEDPPFVQDFLGFNFDASHGDPVGRFVSLQMIKGW